MDQEAMCIANWLVGNDEDAATLEITYLGPVLYFEESTWIAICGGNFNPWLDNQPIPNWRPVWVSRGSLLKFQTAQSGCCTYLAVAGGFQVNKVMGSRSTYLKARLGGFQGRALKKGDLLPIFQQEKPPYPWKKIKWHVSPEFYPTIQDENRIRVTLGKQFDLFSTQSKQKFFSQPFEISSQSDRMGYRLNGTRLTLDSPIEMISEAVACGTIQVPADGNPIILLRDRQTVGGYPKIAEVISVDLPKLAQMQPGKKVFFQEVSVETAQQLYAERQRELRFLQQMIEQKRKEEPYANN
jgi:antagonist of KipI